MECKGYLAHVLHIQPSEMERMQITEFNEWVKEADKICQTYKQKSP